MFKKNNPNDFYEKAEYLSDLKECLYRDFVALSWSGKGISGDYDSGASGVPIFVDYKTVILACSYDRGSYYLKTFKNLSNPGNGYKSAFEILRYPKISPYTEIAAEIINWVKQINNSKIEYNSRYKTVKGILYTAEVGREQFGDYFCEFKFKAFDRKTGKCLYELDEVNTDMYRGNEFWLKCVKKILDKFPKCPLFDTWSRGAFVDGNYGWKELTIKKQPSGDSNTNYTDALINEYN